jgi:spermidine synthase
MSQGYTLLDSSTEHGTTMHLFQRDDEFSIRVEKEDSELMNNEFHYSEDVLAKIACEHVHTREQPHLLIGGLGMGFTLASALKHSSASAKIIVSELMHAVVRWNQTYLAHLAEFPLHDNRVQVLEQDVGQVMTEHKNTFDAIMLDVDNGPDGYTRDSNDNLYGLQGLNNAYEALKPGGILTVWSAEPDIAFTQRMMKVGFEVEQQLVKAHPEQTSGPRHTIWSGVRY